jgi:hypothetical protein
MTIFNATTKGENSKAQRYKNKYKNGIDSLIEIDIALKIRKRYNKPTITIANITRVGL